VSTSCNSRIILNGKSDLLSGELTNVGVTTLIQMYTRSTNGVLLYKDGLIQ
jgi:hypothetical protein